MMISKIREWKEAELILHFQLNKIAAYQTPLMQEWFEADFPIFDSYEQRLFDEILQDAQDNIAAWGEEDLKMYFIPITN